MHPTLHVLGTPAVHLNGERLEPLPSKVSALLMYLACAPGWVLRDDLLYLLWPDTPEKKARNNLRQLLHRVGDVTWADALEREATRLRWTVPTDVRRFREALAAGSLEEAVEHYRGPLLDGFRLGDVPEFDNWLELERDALHAAWRDAALTRAEALREAEEAEAAATLLGSLLATDPLDEVALRAHLEALQSAGRRTAALAEYETYRERLQAELGVEPEPATEALVDAIRKGRASNASEKSETTTRAPLLPTPATPFVGRREQLAELGALLDDPDARLITITGGGGMGKTRLALQAAQQQLERGAFPGGVYFAPLDALSASGAVPAKLAETLGLDPTGADPLGLVAERVGRVRTLLVLDNFEHLLDAAPRLAELLRDAPGITLLATSRERLNLAGEWRFPLKGMAHPAAGESNPDGTHDAVKLFLARARQIDPSFAPDPGARRAVVRVCRLVEGSPLAIELAAALLRVLPPEDIAEELERDPDVLASSARDAPRRHRSVRAVFEYSWALLAPEERAALRRLAVFRGGFTRRSAAEVAGTTIPVLASLVDKSLLRMGARDRYDRHPLIYHYTREKLALHPDEARTTAADHAAHFARFSAGLRFEFNGPDPQHAKERLADEFENCHAAWDWALAERNGRRLLELVNAVWFRFGNWHPASEVIGFWEAAAATLDSDDPKHREALGMMFALQAQYRGDDALAKRGLELLRPHGNRMGLGHCFAVLAYNAQLDGRFDEARGFMRQHLDVAVPDLRGGLLANFADLEMDQGRHAAAKERLLEALSVSRSTQATRSMVDIRYRLGRVHLLTGEFDAAQRHYHEGLALARERGFEPGGDQEPEGLVGLARVALARMDLGRAHELASRVRIDDERAGITRIGASVVLGRVATARGEHERAETRFRQALAMLDPLSSVWWAADLLAPDILLAWSELRLAQGRADAAAAMLGYLLANTHAAYHLEAAEALLERTGLPEAERNRARREGERLQLEEAVALAR